MCLPPPTAGPAPPWTTPSWPSQGCRARERRSPRYGSSRTPSRQGSGSPPTIRYTGCVTRGFGTPRISSGSRAKGISCFISTSPGNGSMRTTGGGTMRAGSPTSRWTSAGTAPASSGLRRGRSSCRPGCGSSPAAGSPRRRPCRPTPRSASCGIPTSQRTAGGSPRSTRVTFTVFTTTGKTCRF